MHVIPQSWSHWHILISVFPSIGLVIALGFYIAGFVKRNDLVKRVCLILFGLLALLFLWKLPSAAHANVPAKAAPSAT